MMIRQEIPSKYAILILCDRSTLLGFDILHKASYILKVHGVLYYLSQSTE